MPLSTPSEELNDLFERLPVALYRSSADGTVLAANQATAELLGYESPGDLLASERAAVLAYADPQRRLEWRREVEEKGISRNFEARLRRRDGSIVWVRDTARAVYDDNGNVRYYEGVLIDITAEVSASLSSSILSEVLESTTDLVVVFDDNETLRYANGAARSFLGLSKERVRERPHFAQVLPGIDRDWARSLLESNGWSGEVAIEDWHGRTTPLWVVITNHLGRDGATYLAAIARDLTQVKETQRRLEELITAKDVFVATVSHELRNPLTGIVGLAEELRDSFQEFGEQERHDLITLIAHQAAEMTALIEDLLVAVRSDVSEVAVVPETVDVVAQLADLAAVHSPTTQWELPNEKVAAWVDPQRFRQIVRNLLSNAERHGGDNVRVGVTHDNGWVRVVVSDDGDGVPPEDIERIFEPYGRASDAPVKQGSVGLGLAVARRLARLMGGDLDYAYEGGWATFRLTLPAVENVSIPSLES
ncbi:MAG TPA: ATP-binding protein [Acidimicrobiia bacterium]|nr:ATP-binding protein [Acidimicrobiia bacterium]